MSAASRCRLALLTGAALALAPDPVALWRDTPVRRLGAPVDPSLRVPFASVFLRIAGEPRLEPGDRVLGLRLPDDRGLHTPRDRASALSVLASLPVGTRVGLELRGARGAARASVSLVETGARRALPEQWPILAAGAALLLFAWLAAIGGGHPVAAPLFAVSLCLGVTLLAALDLALPNDTGLVGLGRWRARLGTLAVGLLPASLLHLAGRFPVLVPRFRRPALAALPYALWAAPAALAQLRFGEPAVVQVVERVSLAASFLAGAVLLAACLRPGRRLRPIERSRARAVTAGLLAAGVGPLATFVGGGTTRAGSATALALGVLALPLALGWAALRYELLAPPERARRASLALASGLGALLGAAVLLAPLAPPDGVGLGLALATLALLAPLRAGLERSLAGGARRPPVSEALVARAGRLLTATLGADELLARVRTLLREELGAAAVEIVSEDESTPRSTLARRGRALWQETASGRLATLRHRARSDDPDPRAPELLLRLEPRGAAPLLLVLAPRPDAVPWTHEELRAALDVGRLAALALGDAIDAARLEAEIAVRTGALRRALADRTALLGAAECIQAAPNASAVRACVDAFLAERTGRPVLAGGEPAAGPDRVIAELCRPPAGRERLVVSGLPVERAADLQPQAEAVCALANLALERLHLLDGLKLEVARQARELARVDSGRKHAEFVRRVAHELRKPGEEIQHLVAALLSDARGAARSGLERIESAALELTRRLDTLLSRRDARLDVRRIDLVPLVAEAGRRVAALRSRRFEVRHRALRLPLLGDPVRIASLIENLLDNAARATREGGRVAVRSGQGLPRDGRGAWVLLEVEDDGVGVSPELGEHIFEPGVGEFPGGFGLGLALCRDIVALHGGRIEVESQPGRSVFRVRLPQLGPDGGEV